MHEEGHSLIYELMHKKEQ